MRTGAPATRAAGRSGPPLVGRAHELATLSALLDDVVARRGRLALVGGEAGVGKTRLLEELTDQAQDRGVAVVWANCWPGEGAPPLWPWTQALRAMDGAGFEPDEELLRQLVTGETVSGLLGDVDPAGARFRLFDRVATTVREVAARHPLLVLLDDLHWADHSSLQLLSLLATGIVAAPVLLVGAYRDVDVSGHDPLGQMLTNLPRDTERVVLTGLAPPAVRQLAASTAGREIPLNVVSTLHSRTGGNPFFVKELVRLLMAQGRLREPGALPVGVREVLDRRLARLSQPAQQALAAAALMGREFSAGLLGDVTGIGADELGAAIDQARAARVVVESGTDRYAFVHDLFRQVLQEGQGSARRQRLHLAIADALEARYEGRLEPLLGAMAHHLLASAPVGDPMRAVDYAKRAGERAARLLAFEEAAGYFERALGVMPAGGSALERAELLLALGDARWRARDIAGARAALVESASIARLLGDAELFGQAALAYGCGLGGNQSPTAAADDTLVELLEEALGRLPAGDSTLRCGVQARLAVELYLTDKVQYRRSLSAETLAMARSLGDPHALAVALFARDVATMGPDGIDERRERAEEILSLARDAGDRELEFWGYLFRERARSERCLPTTADLAACRRLAEQLRNPSYRAETALRQAVLALVEGRFDDADRLMVDIETASPTDPASGPTLVAVMMLVAYLKGPIEAIEPMLQVLIPEHPDRLVWRAAAATLYVELGRYDDARREFEAVATRGFDLPRDGNWLFAVYMLAMTCCALGDRERAELLHRMALPHSEYAPLGAFGSMATAVGLTEAALGHYDDAFRWLAIGQERNRTLANHAFALWARREEAAVYLARDEPGDRARARELLADVTAEIRTRGFLGFLTRAEALAQQAAGDAASVSTGTAVASIRRDGPTWEVVFDGMSARVAHTKGVADLAVLLSIPGREVHAADLTGAVRAASTGEILDVRARRELRERLIELEDELAEAEAFGDVGRAERAATERDELAAHLASALGLGGRPRRTGDVDERARKAVTWRIRRAIRAVEDVHPALGRHLDRSIRTGSFCSYRPDSPLTWTIG